MDRVRQISGAWLCRYESCNRQRSEAAVGAAARTKYWSDNYSITAHILGIIITPTSTCSFCTTTHSSAIRHSRSSVSLQPSAVMCGIFFSLSTSKPVLPTDETRCLLQKRGPDSFQVHSVQHNSNVPNTYYLTFVSSVLSLRGDHVHRQPLVDPESNSVFCWNGEAWKVAGKPVEDNDTEVIFKRFLEAAKLSSASERPNTTDRRNATHRLANVISNISGPFSFVFYDAVNSKLFFSRDCLGRRSLLQGFDDTGSLKICSLCDGTSSTHFEEVDTNGVHMIDLISDGASINTCSIETLPWGSENSTCYLVCTSIDTPAASS